MLAVSRSRSLYQRLNDIKDRLDLHSLSLHTSATSTVNLLRDADPVVFAIRRGDVDAVNDLATSAPHSLLKENKDGWIPLHDAAHCGQAECLKALLRAHPSSVDKRTLQEQTALLLAVSCEHLSCVRCLLEAGADPDISSKNKETPLYKACEVENVEIVSLILSYGATVNQRCGQGWTALHEAVSRNNTEICEILIRAGATINLPNTYSIAPLCVAAQRGQMRALSYLIGKGADVNMQTCEGLTALHEASKNGHKEIVALLLSKNADANKPTNSGLLPLHIAAQYGHHEIVSLLVSVTSRAMLRHSWISPLHLAAEHNRHNVAAVLLKTGADVNATLAHSHTTKYADRRTTALYFAIANGSTKTAEVLLNAGASLTLDPVSPLLMAVRQGCVSTVSLLLERGADVNVRIPSYSTTFPVVIALCMNNLSLLKCLLDSGCDAFSCFTCKYGSAPHPASGGSHVRTVSSNEYVLQNDIMLPFSCSEPSSDNPTQFCEWISTPLMCKWAGLIIDLLLEHVSHVQLCSKLSELLDGREEWLAVKRKSLSPCPLQHLCRLRIRTQLGRHRLKSLTSLPLPDRLIRYMSLAD
ncbi:ankyrin repeat and SOCS box protein 2-like isoform X2 [Mastacembelus armatus]|uniref:ankyrin repeat and SOCS box protein 2-like isoform X2 n=1 Tax=Mastacembelus armatus TaxID=205130 RepID=UPI000E45825E|nr:ankyrin repeat and SOCS box protein 2-like isoform X2 [Mastacembelus armatus]XP_026154291.1 ankyrin repeat and SOCS box protein 2-like isoform X2 [Mastacembelus armatus]XP_026154295.1 ankyrin repeat and SOCS box protein 2-like isoform X2 [Mastacembelus armatus]XP_026154303.1 ankyrin repeat and SOCS box protein 2-like isoform X2 [Mastacembelus armatus]XP_026154311.1 ankyrin repeat and SOCS box protein 2-like isoform X2 [Mastacembelus armatus]XP_026154318.1 ankyrin repeat and SOCS box protein